MTKKEFTSFDVAVVVGELKNAIVDSRVNNVYQLDPKTIVLKLHKTSLAPLRLVMEAGKRLHLTNYSIESPHVPPAFCMALRKYLRGAWITDIIQHEFERIVAVQFRTKEDRPRLILELFGEGNIIFTSEKAEILQALVFKRMRDRNILRNEVFQLPPSAGENPFKVTKEMLKESLKKAGEAEVVRAIARFLGVGGFYAEEILLRAGVDKVKHCSDLTADDFDALYGHLQDLLRAISTSQAESNIVLAGDNTFLDVAPFRLKHYEAYKTQQYDSFNLALDEFYSLVTTTAKAVSSVQTDRLNREAERLRHVIAAQEQALREDENRVDRDRRIGDTIYAHSVEIQSVLTKFAEAKQQDKALDVVFSEISASKTSSSNPEDIFESFDARNQALNIFLDDLHFSLNLRKTLFENAADYYERGKKAKQKSEGAKAALEESRRKLSEIERKITEAEALKLAKPAEAVEKLAERKVKIKEWFEKFHWFTSSDGFLVVAGKDTVSNEVLIKRYAAKDDVVFHAEITGAPFVLVKSEGKTVSEQTLRESAEFAAAYSRAWRENTGSADVYWVKPDQLSKSGPSGEYVPHGAFAVNGKRNWTRSVSLRLAIGVVTNGDVVFVGGPVDAVKAKTNVYLTLAPGDLMGKELLKRVLGVLASKLPKDKREKVGKSSVEAVREFVPYTKASLTEIK